MTSPTLREALERAVALIRECRLADAAAARDPSAEGRWDRAMDALFRAEADLRGELGADAATTSHVAGRRAGLEDQGHEEVAAWHDAQARLAAARQSSAELIGGNASKFDAARKAHIAAATAIRNLAGDERIGDG